MIFTVSLIALLSFSSLTQGWMIVKVKLHEAALLVVVIVALFRPGVVMDRFYPEFAPLDLDKFAAGEVAAERGYTVRFHVVRSTDYGDRFKLYRLATPDMSAAGPEDYYGVTLSPIEDGGYEVAELARFGLAEQAGLELFDQVTDVDVEQVGQPPKQLVYPFGLALLGVVIFSQLIRLRRMNAAGAGAASG